MTDTSKQSLLDRLQVTARSLESKSEVYSVEWRRIDVRSIRISLSLTQSDFSRKFGIPLTNIRNWEQGIRQPDQSAIILLMVIKNYPELVLASIAREQESIIKRQ